MADPINRLYTNENIIMSIKLHFCEYYSTHLPQIPLNPLHWTFKDQQQSVYKVWKNWANVIQLKVLKKCF